MNTDVVDAMRGDQDRSPEIGTEGVARLWRERPPYFDGLEIGDSMDSSGRTITEYDVVSFATLTGDFHPQHADAAWAEESPFGRRIAHGMLVISYALGLLPIDPRVVMALRSMESAVLKRPVGLGDTIRVKAKVIGKRPLGKEAGLVTLGVRILNQDKALVARMELIVLWRREGDTASRSAKRDGSREGDRDEELSPIQDGRFLA